MRRQVLPFTAVAIIGMCLGSVFQPLAYLQVQAQQGQQANCQTFPETGQTVCGRFLNYWQTHGGLAQQGFPISDEFQERSDLNGQTYAVQYFERAVFEYHPENQPPNDVLLSLLGVFRYRQEYPDGTPHQRPSDKANRALFVETGKYVGGVFLEYWYAHGGLAQQGYPISEEFNEVSDLNGKSYTVQYFERAVFEWHPENARTPYEVLLSQLGKFRYNANYGSGPVFPRTATSGCWTNYTNPLAGTSNSRLAAVDAVADDDVWAVGDVGIGKYEAYHLATLTMHWDGAEWRRVPSPNKVQSGNPPDPYLNRLVGVSGTSPNDVWAVGRTMVLHWDGRAWREIAYPVDGWLTGVAALSPTDVWVVGFVGPYQSSAGFLILHWDGKSWTRIRDVDFSGVVGRGRDTARGGGLGAIKAFSPNDIWAVGSGSTPNSQARPIAIHWDGVRWSATLLDPQDNFVQLNGLGGNSSQDLWTVGQRRGIDSGGTGYGPYVFTAHWDGSAWSSVDAPDPINWKHSGGTLYGVSSLGKDDVWAVGSAMPEGDRHSFLLHWDGQHWAVVRTPLARGDLVASELSGVTSVHGRLWAVGLERPPGGALASIVHHAANCKDPALAPTVLTPTRVPYAAIPRENWVE